VQAVYEGLVAVGFAPAVPAIRGSREGEPQLHVNWSDPVRFYPSAAQAGREFDNGGDG
jgi:hypothetical protein